MTCSVPHKAKLLFLLTMIFIYTFLWNSHTSSMQVLTKPPFAEARVPHDIAMLRNLISSKMEYPPRKVPEKEEVVKVDPHLSSLIDQQFLPNIKSPCWYEEIANKLVSNPYNSSYFAKHDKVFKDLLTTMNADFKKYLHYSGGKQFRLRCLPYFYIIGQPKCGTTDLFYRLLEHPQLKYNAFKEPHWWNRRRFGGLYGKHNDGNISMESYLDIFDWAARNIEVGLREGPSANNSALKIVTGEASAATMWDSMTSEFESNTREDGPHILTADIIHIAQPDAKFIAIFRDPVERLYSDYLYFHDSIKTVEDFHQKVLDSLKVFEACLSTSSLRCCAYMGYSTPKSLRIYIGMYVIYLLDWLTILDKNQILILRLEDYSANLNETLHRVYNFLGVDPLPKELEERIVERDKANSQKEKISSVGSMLPATRDILKAFYSPFNRKLASVLKNKAFLWP